MAIEAVGELHLIIPMKTVGLPKICSPVLSMRKGAFDQRLRLPNVICRILYGGLLSVHKEVNHYITSTVHGFSWCVLYKVYPSKQR